MSTYIFNEHMVCINPEKIVIYKNKKCSYIISIACLNNVWCYGIDAQSHHAGSSSPCMLPADCCSRSEAIKEACKYLIFKAEYFMCKSKMQVFDAILKLTNPVYTQIQLF